MMSIKFLLKTVCTCFVARAILTLLRVQNVISQLERVRKRTSPYSLQVLQEKPEKRIGQFFVPGLSQQTNKGINILLIHEKDKNSALKTF